ncbi:WS/DGAT/MGAT family O-acyltransferase [Roseiflexus sp.]|uniref:WS/DGAT/MGAT family O-acyltransferase n=1 Tax=Roseiflexus sp. TaxID=2562120 RepID=UPI00398B146A
MAQDSHPLGAVDSAWLHMDDPTNLMMVTGVALLDGSIDVERCYRTFESRLLFFERFRMRVADHRGSFGTPRWEPDPHFSIRSHIHRVALPSPGDMTTLQEFLGDLASTPLDYTKPLWQVHLVENVLGGSAVVMRFHHCIGDGVAMNTVMRRLMDTTPDAPIEIPKPQSNHNLGPLLEPIVSTIEGSIKLADDLVHEGMEFLRHPEHLLDLPAQAASGAMALSRVLLLPPETKTLFKGPLGVQKRVAWSSPTPLERVKEIGRVAGAKVNDVLLAAVAGALRTYLIEHGARVDGLEIRAVIPVDLRPPSRAHDLGNEFGLVFLSLPLGTPGPTMRLAEIKQRMEALKRSPEAYVFYGLLNFFGRTPAQVEEQAVNLFGSKATAVMTNVRGPLEQLYLAGNRITNIMFWVPQSGRLGMGVSIMSYCGQVTLGVITDAGLVPDPETITAAFEKEFHVLHDAIVTTGEVTSQS